MTNFGILSQATGLRVHDISAIHNGRDGIAGREGSLVVNSVAIENGQDGVDVNTGSVVDGVTAVGNGRNGVNGQGTGSVVTRTSARHNGMKGFSLGIFYKFGRNNASSGNGEADLCGGGICTDRRRIYLTQEGHSGNEVLTACRLGFHPSSIHEVIDAGQFQYDTTLGETGNSVHSGPPNSRGWVTHDLDDSDNCNGFTSGASTVSGVTVVLQPVPLEVVTGGGAHPAEAPAVGLSDCDDTRWGVWCVEDY
jgi:hypothetical protein